MIKGFRLLLTHDELRLHCEARADYHERRAADKTATLPDLQRSLDTIRGASSPASLSVMNKSGYHLGNDDPVADLKKDIETHNNKVLLFRFFASHLFREEYDLGEDDLVRLEIVRQR